MLRGGWDLLAFEATILGAHGPALLARVQSSNRPWRLRIAIDDSAVAFRDNLELLAPVPVCRCVAWGVCA